MTVRLTDELLVLIKQLAAGRDVSMSEIIRIGMTDFPAASGAITRAERIRRALAVTGRFRSDKTDVSERHDAYLSGAYES